MHFWYFYIVVLVIKNAKHFAYNIHMTDGVWVQSILSSPRLILISLKRYCESTEEVSLLSDFNFMSVSVVNYGSLTVYIDVWYFFFTERYECNISQLNSLNDVIHKLDSSVNLVFSKCMFISIHILSWYEYWTDNKITFAKANTFSTSGCHRKLSYCKHLFICPVHNF